MPRAVPADIARRRRDRLAELLEALGAARGSRVTQREFAASIGREQGTVAAILGGHRALGGDVMMAVVQAYRLPPDYFDAPLRPDPRPFARAAAGDGASQHATTQAIAPSAPAIRPIAREMPGIASAVEAPARHRPAAPSGGAPGDALAEVLASLAPDRAAAMALEALARKGVRLDEDGWVRLTIGAQSAHEHGVLVDWFDRTLASYAPAEPDAPLAGAAAPATERESSGETAGLRLARRR